MNKSENLLKKAIIFLVLISKFCILFIFQNFMKKYSIFLWLATIFSFSLLWNISNAEYNLQIDADNNEVYLTSWDDKITLENADKYLSWNKNSSDSISWSTLTLTTSSPNDTAKAETWSEVNTWTVEWTWSIDWTWTEIWTWTIMTWTETSTWASRILWENINAELLTWDEFDRALYWMYMNWLTKYNNSDEFRPYDNLTREESAKMIGQLYSVLWFSKEDKWFNCNFVDTNLFDPTLSEHIYNIQRKR